MASPEERRRFAAAGEIPLSSENVARLAEGRGISPMASTAEKEAWKMGEFMTGRREQAPVEYGGLGDRPVGTSRRAIRMQAEWDKQQADMLERQRIMQQMDLQQKEQSRLQRQQDFELQKFNMAEDRESRILDEAGLMIDSIRGKMGPDGNWISKPIRPEDPDALDRLDNLARQFKFGIENEAANFMFSTLYKDASNLRESAATDARKIEEQQRSWLVGQQEEAASFGIDTAKFFKTDPETGAITNVDQLGLSKAIGEAKRKDLENKKREIATAKLDEESKSQARSILDEINKTDSEIRRANFDAARTKGSIRDENIAKAEFLRSERDVLVERFSGLMPQKPSEGAPQPQSFDSVEAAQAANLPKGTIVVIGGRRARID